MNVGLRLRELTFIILHSSDILGKLDAEVSSSHHASAPPTDSYDLQFRMRYTNHKIPLTALRGSFLTRLKKAGLKFSDVQKKELRSIAKELKESKKEEEDEDTEAGENEDILAVDADVAKGDLVDDDSDLIDALTAEDTTPSEETKETEEPPKRKRGRKPKSQLDDEKNKTFEERIEDRYINLVDILPPIPKKGAFRVEDIKGFAIFLFISFRLDVYIPQIIHYCSNSRLLLNIICSFE